MKLSKISRGDIHVETDKGIVRILGEAISPRETEFSEYLVYRNSFSFDGNDVEIDEEFKVQIVEFLKNELLARKTKLIIE